MNFCHCTITALPCGHVVAELSGELDIAAAPTLRGALRDAVAGARRGVVVDMDGVTFIDASCLGVLVGAHRQARHLPDGLRLAAVPGHVRHLLHVTGLDVHLPVCPTLVAVAGDHGH